MTARFASNLIVLVLGGFLTTATFAFGGGTVGWLGFGASAGVVALLLVAFALRGRGRGQRVLDVALMLAAAWTIVATRTFGDPARQWLVFAFGAFAVALAAIGLAMHEARLERALRDAAAPAPSGRFVRAADRDPVGLAS